jgi:hypothetical protein
MEYILTKDPINNNLDLFWEETNKLLELRELLLQQGIKFHRSAKNVINKKFTNYNLKY